MSESEPPLSTEALPAVQGIPGFSFRRANNADLPHIIDLAVEMVLHSASPYRFVPVEVIRKYRHDDLQGLYQAIEDDNFRVFLACDEEDKIVGHVLIHCGNRDSATGQNQAWVYDLSVAPQHWHSGLGQALMNLAEGFARQRGLTAVGLGVTLANQRAVNFYRKLGFLDERLQMVKVL